MRPSYRLLAVSALALSAGVFTMPKANAASLLSNDIVVAQAQSADPGSRKGDVPGTTQPVPAPSQAPTYNNTAPRAGTGPGASGRIGDRAGDVPGSTPAVPAPATTTDRANAKNGRVSSDPGSRKGDVPGTQQPVPQATGGAPQCQAISDMADRQACISRSQSGKR